MSNEETSTAAGAAVIGDVGGNDDMMDSLLDDMLDEPVVSSNDGAYKPLKTIPAFSIHMLVSVIISFVGITLAALWPDEKRCEAYFIMLYLRAAFWLFTFLFDHLIKKLHNDHRLHGYHGFHKETAMQRATPLIIVSLWNTAILAMQTFMHHYYGEKFWQHCAGGWFSPIVYITAFNMTETLVLTATHSCYIDKVRRYNRARLPPDALRGHNTMSGGSVGILSPSGDVRELLDRQADLIAFYKDYIVKLNHRFNHMLQNQTQNQLRQLQLQPELTPHRTENA